ncbi:hypothetical protein Tco_1052479 [Tanacetum coccineum]
MAQPQQQRDVPQDQICPPNKKFDLRDANKKFDLVNPQCPNESKILADILNNHPLRTCVAASIRVHDNHHRVDNYDLVKNIFNSRKIVIMMNCNRKEQERRFLNGC